MFQLKQMEEAWKKNQGFNGIRTRDLHDTGTMLYQLSCGATHWQQGQLIEFISSCEELTDVKYNYMKFTAMIILHFHLQPQIKYEYHYLLFVYGHTNLWWGVRYNILKRDGRHVWEHNFVVVW